MSCMADIADYSDTGDIKLLQCGSCNYVNRWGQVSISQVLTLLYIKHIWITHAGTFEPHVDTLCSRAATSEPFMLALLNHTCRHFMYMSWHFWNVLALLNHMCWHFICMCWHFWTIHACTFELYVLTHLNKTQFQTTCTNIYTYFIHGNWHLRSTSADMFQTHILTMYAHLPTHYEQEVLKYVPDNFITSHVYWTLITAEFDPFFFKHWLNSQFNITD